MLERHSGRQSDRTLDQFSEKRERKAALSLWMQIESAISERPSAVCLFYMLKLNFKECGEKQSHRL